MREPDVTSVDTGTLIVQYPGVTLGESATVIAQAGEKRVSKAYHFNAYHLHHNSCTLLINALYFHFKF